MKNLRAFRGRILPLLPRRLPLPHCLLALLLLPLYACDGDVDFGEQYKKTIYLVGAGDLLRVAEHAYGAVDDRIVFSVYRASSRPDDRPVTVQLAIDHRALDSLNQRRRLENPLHVDRVLLPPSRLALPPSLAVTILPGRQYATLALPVNLDGLDADTAYALPVAILSNDAGYDVNPALRAVIREIAMINPYSGDYSGSSVEHPDTLAPAVIRPVQPALKAISATQVRLVIHDLEDDPAHLDTRYMLLTIAPDDTVTITPWRRADVQPLPGSRYDPALQSFELHYAASGKIITEKIANIRAPHPEY
ncbi:MAG: DUF1735 domain-containing protein [Odoribacteraceae bacterium]|nr:DUF1735 domain-containing protein [Odoribacteraceae bacterium]